MVRKIFLTLLFLALAIPASACACMGKGNMVDVRIVSDRGGEFTKYRTYPRVHDDGTYFYVEAAKGQRYAVQVVNRSDRRGSTAWLKVDLTETAECPIIW